MSNLSIQVAGTVDVMGSPVVGTDYTSQIIGQGQYKVTIDSNEFDSPPVVLVTVDTSREGNEYTACASVHNVEPNSFIVSIKNMNNNLVPFRFNFICLRA